MNLGIALLLLTSLFLLIFLLIWIARPLSQGGANIGGGQGGKLGDSPEWQSFIGRRKEIEEDPLLDDVARQSLLGAWREMAETSRTLIDKSANMSSTGIRKILTLNGPVFAGMVLITGTLVAYLIGAFNESSFSMPKAADRSIASLPGQRNLVTSGGHPGDGVPLEERLEGLKQRLQENPGDVNGWVLLARTQASVSDYEASALSLRKALALVPGHPGLLADLADMVAMANGRKMEGEPTELIAQALANDPNHEKSLALAATAAEQAGNNERAQGYWQRLSQVQQARMAQSAASEPAPSAPVQQATASGAGVSGAFVLTAAQLQNIPPQAVLFVFLKEQAGPGMPAAVVKMPVSGLKPGGNSFVVSSANLIRNQDPSSLPDSMFLQVRLAVSGSVQPSAEDLVSDWLPVRFKVGEALTQPITLGKAANQ